MDLLQLANTCGFQDGKSFNFTGKRPVVLDLNKKSDCETKTKQPIAFCDLTRFWDTIIGIDFHQDKSEE